MADTTREILVEMAERTGLGYSALGAKLGFSANAIHNWMREPKRKVSSTSDSLVRIAYRCLCAGRWDLVTGGMQMTKLGRLVDEIEATLKSTIEATKDDDAGLARYVAAQEGLHTALEQILLRDAELRRAR